VPAKDNQQVDWWRLIPRLSRPLKQVDVIVENDTTKMNVRLKSGSQVKSEKSGAEK